MFVDKSEIVMNKEIVLYFKNTEKDDANPKKAYEETSTQDQWCF